MKDKSQLYAGIIWIISATALLIYGILLFLNSEVPGMGELVNFLTNIDKKYIYFAAFLSIFIEGLYFIGSFFPGASLVMIVAIISGASGYLVFCTTLILIFIGWNLSGIINIYLAKIYRNKIAKLAHCEDYHVKDRVWTTWFPAFRSSYEVAQVTEGGHPMKVFTSSIRVRFWATLFVGVVALVIPLILNINNLSDRENYITISVVFFISLIVGFRKIKSYFLSKKV
jgi:membrane protein DedA with SNARE-associated domain